MRRVRAHDGSIKRAVRISCEFHDDAPCQFIATTYPHTTARVVPCHMRILIRAPWVACTPCTRVYIIFSLCAQNHPLILFRTSAPSRALVCSCTFRRKRRSLRGKRAGQLASISCRVRSRYDGDISATTRTQYIRIWCIHIHEYILKRAILAVTACSNFSSPRLRLFRSFSFSSSLSVRLYYFSFFAVSISRYQITNDSIGYRISHPTDRGT